MERANISPCSSIRDSERATPYTSRSRLLQELGQEQRLMRKSISMSDKQIEAPLIFLVLVGCVLAAISVQLLDQVNKAGFVLGAMSEGAAVACCVAAYRMTRRGKRAVPVTGLALVGIIFVLEVLLAIAFLIRG